MSQRIAFVLTGSSPIIRAKRVVYYADFSAGVGNIRLMVRPCQEPWQSGNLWLPASAVITTTPLVVAEAGFNSIDNTRGFDWRIDCTRTSGTITVDFFSVEKGQ